MCAIHGAAITTIEGIGSLKAGLHPAQVRGIVVFWGGITFTQERLSKLHGSQCGYCTPGIVMSMYALLRNNPTPDLHSVENNFDGMYLS